MSQVVAGSQKADPLRKQLDELDQLMERMLALGVQAAPPEPPREPPRQAVATPVKLDTVAEEVIEQTAEAPLSPAVEFAPPAEVPYHSEFDLQKSAVESALAEPADTDAPIESDLGPALELAPSAPTFVSLEASAAVPAAPLFAEFQFAPPPSLPVLEPEAAPVVSRLFTPRPDPTVIVAWWLQPLALVNYAYDGSTRWLGPIGRGLRSRPMRNLLGICGVACVLGALAWVLWEGTDWNS